MISLVPYDRLIEMMHIKEAELLAYHQIEYKKKEILEALAGIYKSIMGINADREKESKVKVRKAELAKKPYRVMNGNATIRRFATVEEVARVLKMNVRDVELVIEGFYSQWKGCKIDKIEY